MRSINHCLEPSFDLNALRESIISNGFVPFEQIVVEAYKTEKSGTSIYLVIEGNRRTAALKTLLSDHDGGALTLRKAVLGSLMRAAIGRLN